MLSLTRSSNCPVHSSIYNQYDIIYITNIFNNKSYVTDQSTVATRIPTPMQSTNTTQRRNLIKLIGPRWRTTVNPMDETEYIASQHHVETH